MQKCWKVLLLCIALLSCNSNDQTYKHKPSLEKIYQRKFLDYPKYISDGFDFPVGKPNARNYYSAQDMGSNFHLGEDWNNRLRNDYGDPVYAIANGYVSYSDDHGGGWGNVIRIVHYLPNGTLLESLYAHFAKRKVKKGVFVSRGQIIGTIGDAGGIYSPHLHFEMRNDIRLPIGPGYARYTNGYLAPTPFITKNRPVAHKIQSQRNQELLQYAKSASLAKLKKLFQGKLDINFQDELGRTALMYAAGKGHTSVVTFLLQKKASKRIRDNYGYTACDKAKFAARRSVYILKRLRSCE
ncbi:MAG: peptidoglycan DD-metalloendopeptidase family protein [Spirochaetota bacterium]